MLLIFFPNDPYTPQASLEKIIVCIRPRDSLFNNLPWDGPNCRHPERDNVFAPRLDTFLESAPFRTSLRQRLLGSTQIRKRKSDALGPVVSGPFVAGALWTGIWGSGSTRSEPLRPSRVGSKERDCRRLTCARRR